MGIRIHKILGYGMDDIQYNEEDYMTKDPRFSKDGYFNIDYESYENRFTDKGFDEYLDAAIKDDTDDKLFNLKLLKAQRARKVNENGQYPYNASISNSIVYDPEFGMENVAVFIPPGNADWQRYDNIIDYYDPIHHDKDGGIDNGTLVLNRTIWPYEAYVDCRTTPPTRLVDPKARLYVDLKYDSAGIMTGKHAEHILKEFEVESVEELHRVIRPIIPEELVTLLKYLKVFADDKHIHELKPMLYWYWG